MTSTQQPKSSAVALAYVGDDDPHDSEHERATLVGFVRRLADLLGYEFGGFYEPSRSYPVRLYFVPSSTLSAEQADVLGIRSAHDLFGGVVPHRFVGTKAISHPLIAPDAAAPQGWNAALSVQIDDAVLPGFTVFTLNEARHAGLQLLQQGRVRLKRVCASGGHGQTVANDARELQAQLDQLGAQQVRADGLVLEADLDEVQTFSVGQVRVGDMTASYFGTQRLTRNNRGEDVFGGSDLTLVRGDFDALRQVATEPQVMRAVEQARRYDAAVRACYPGFFASRSNYDVVVGRDAKGRQCSGVLEQSWRVGGATGAEIAGLEVFRAQPGRQLVRASTVESYGDSPEPPPQAVVYFRGTDPKAGRLTKYTLVERDGDPR